jgi:membrane-associated protein
VVAAHGQAQLPAMIAVAWLGTAGGDLTSFLLGRRFERAALDRHGGRIGLGPQRVALVEGFFTAHGPRAILVGRFIGLFRAVAPFLAGTSELTLRAFLPWSLIGAAAWASLFVTVGYAFSSSFERATGTLTKVALGLALVISGVLVLRSRRRRRLAPTS